jgi:hypothetical protein
MDFKIYISIIRPIGTAIFAVNPCSGGRRGEAGIAIATHRVAKGPDRIALPLHPEQENDACGRLKF